MPCHNERAKKVVANERSERNSYQSTNFRCNGHKKKIPLDSEKKTRTFTQSKILTGS